MIRTAVVALILFALTVATFWPVREFGFVNLDDPDNVSRNALVYEGLTTGNLKQAMTTSDPDYWRPLTWVSYMIDTELWRAVAKPTTHPKIPLEIPHGDARGYHLTNVILHGLAAVILLIALHALTGCFWKSVIVAAIFAVHSLRVESVAWITERKDVLSGVCAFASLWAYARYGRGSILVSRPAWNWLWMLVATVFLALGLMSKSTLVTWPFVFLLLDYWPLNRIDLSARASAVVRRVSWLVVEKLPMFIVVAGSCWMTLHGGQRSLADLPLMLRLSNAAVSGVRYIGKLFWPVDLAVYYPYPGIGGVDPWTRTQIFGSVVILAIISIVAIALIRRSPAVIVGWLWFVGMLVPVIGLIQVGNQGMADRFTYLPGIGLTLIVIWTLAGFLRPSWMGTVLLAVICAGMLMGCIAATRRVLPTWANTDALYQRALEVTRQNRAVHIYYGDYLFHEKRHNEAMVQFLAAADLTPEDPLPRFKLGFIHTELKAYFKAQQEFEAAVRLDPGYADAHYNIAYVLVRRGQTEAARPHLLRALELKPDSADYQELRRELTSSDNAKTGSSP